MKKALTIIIACCLLTNAGISQFQTISQDELRDKISGYWIGQCVGNYMGFPFEGTYLEEAIPIFIDRYYQFDDDSSLAINRNDLRGYLPVVTNWLEGAYPTSNRK